MSDHVDHAAEVIKRDGDPGLSRVESHRAARALDAAGLLVSPERDAAVAAKALRAAQADIKARIKGMTEAGAEETHVSALHDAWSLLNNRARDIEREVGESGA